MEENGDPCRQRPSRESVLDAFAVESEPGRSTLERYLRLYPEYAGELIDLSCELSREVMQDAAPLSAADRALIDAAWTQHAKAMPAAAADPFAALTIDDWRAVAQRLDLPRQVVTALRERRVSRVNIPRRFLAMLAEAMQQLRSRSWSCPGARPSWPRAAIRRTPNRCRRAGHPRASADRCRRPGGETRPAVGGGGLTWTAWSSPGKSPPSFTLASSHLAPTPGRL